MLSLTRFLTLLYLPAAPGAVAAADPAPVAVAVPGFKPGLRECAGRTPARRIFFKGQQCLHRERTAP
ncbi:MAG: hypothetical protein DRJ61_07515 [Acidobacteria bacterium]|nr:MAG: hypothetical protein DRJ65_21325 [Acidobacteriota bacterium]RLE33308.1 MAG: hypothetical protein DRJ61_07515 [Acidobacteriota bacterium]